MSLGTQCLSKGKLLNTLCKHLFDIGDRSRGVTIIMTVKRNVQVMPVYCHILSDTPNISMFYV